MPENEAINKILDGIEKLINARIQNRFAPSHHNDRNANEARHEIKQAIQDWMRITPDNPIAEIGQGQKPN